jgi:hypothetical protein
MRHPGGSLPDLFLPADRSWLVSALWDDTWTCVGGPEPLINTLQRDPLANAGGSGPTMTRCHRD